MFDELMITLLVFLERETEKKNISTCGPRYMFMMVLALDIYVDILSFLKKERKKILREFSF